MSEDKERTIGQRVRDENQRAGRYEKLARKGRGPHPSGASYEEKARDAQHAGGLFRSIRRLFNA